MVKPWSGGFQGEFNIPVSQSISTWSARLEFEHGVNKLEVSTANSCKRKKKFFSLLNIIASVDTVKAKVEGLFNF